MMRAHQPGSQPIDIPEAIPNPAIPQPVPAPSPAPKPKEPVKTPVPQNAVGLAGNDLRAPRGEMKRSMETTIHHLKLYSEGHHVPVGEAVPRLRSCPCSNF